MRLVRRVRWLRVSLVGLLALVAFLSLRLWQWMAYAEGQAAGAERAELTDERAAALEVENDRLNRELKDARILVHGNDEIVRFEYHERALLLPANERLEELLSQEYIPTNAWTRFTQDEIRALWTSLSRYHGNLR